MIASELRLDGRAREAVAQESAHRRSVFYLKTDVDAATLERTKNVAIDVETLTVAVRRAIGEARADLLPMSGGTFHRLFAVKNAAADLVVRVTLSPSPADLLVNHWAARVFASAGVPTCASVLVDSTAPLSFEILHRAAGHDVRSVEDAETQELPPELFAAIGSVAARIHSVPGERFGLLDPESVMAASSPRGSFDRWADYLLFNLPAHVIACRRIGAVNENESREILDFFDASREMMDAVAEPSVLHGDFGHHNIFVRDGEITAVIDWEDALVGDRMFDVAYWATFTRDAFLEPFLTGYSPDGAMLGRKWRERFWLYYLRIALSKTVHRDLFGYSERPGRPAASRRIQRALGHLRDMDVAR